MALFVSSCSKITLILEHSEGGKSGLSDRQCHTRLLRAHLEIGLISKDLQGIEILVDRGDFSVRHGNVHAVVVLIGTTVKAFASRMGSHDNLITFGDHRDNLIAEFGKGGGELSHHSDQVRRLLHACGRKSIGPANYPPRRLIRKKRRHTIGVPVVEPLTKLTNDFLICHNVRHGGSLSIISTGARHRVEYDLVVQNSLGKLKAVPPKALAARKRMKYSRATTVSCLEFEIDCRTIGQRRTGIESITDRAKLSNTGVDVKLVEQVLAPDTQCEIFGELIADLAFTRSYGP